LDQVANLPGVSFIRTPIRPRAKNSVITEGRAATLASAWNRAGFTGQGVKVAVIDTGFSGLATLKATDEIPASAVEMDFSGTGMTSGTDGHGCACAELVYDTAPGVQMYLIKSLEPSDDEAAKNYCKAQGVQIISQSGGYDALNFHDGAAYSSITPHPVTIVNDAVANGILWVNAAGNEQVQHAMTEWRDGNADGGLDWAPASEDYYSVNELWNYLDPIPVGAEISAYLTWNEWPVTDQDFDLYLYRWTGTAWTQVASSENFQTGTQPPRESIDFTVSIPGDYGFRVVKFSATRSPTFILRSHPYELFYYGYNNYSTPSPGSINIPSDAASCFTVGAIDYSTYTTGPIEWFSSLGPNNGAYTFNPTVMKPDICGPDWVSTVTYGVGGFGGTSPSAPHIAALAALVKSRFPTYSNAQLRSYLENCGIDRGSAGQDNTYGYGPCVLNPLILSLLATNSAATLTWSAVSGLNYRVQYKTNLSDTAWSDLSPDVPASGATASKTNQPLVSRRFYQIRQMP
jgi:subtilisin family serine protease